MLLLNHKYFHWYYFLKNKRHLFNMIVGIFIWLFLVLTQPFGVYNNNFGSSFILIIVLFAFGFFWIPISYFLDFIGNSKFKKKPKEDYTIDSIMFLIKIILLIHTIFFFRAFMCNWRCINLYEYIELWFACLLMTLLIYIPFSFYAKSLFYKQIIGKNPKDNHLFVVKGEGNDQLTIDLTSIVYFKADDNYVDITFISQNDQIEKKTLRSSLKSVENQLKVNSQFVRIHRSYIVNFQHITSYSRHTVSIEKESLKETFSISKKYQAKVKDLFS